MIFAMLRATKLVSLSLSLLPSLLWGGAISYSVDFQGVSDAKVLRSLRSISQLIALKKKPPASVNALRYRAESDIPELVSAMHALGYLEADIGIQIVEERGDYHVRIEVHPGPLYTIEQYHIRLDGMNSTEVPEGCDLSMRALGLSIGDPADTRKILDSELTALHILSQYGYPLAMIGNREIIADGQTKRIKIFLTISTGPLARFGPSTIDGNTSVCDLLIEQKMEWCEGDRYNSCLVEGTQQELMDTGLFSSVYITHAKEVDEASLLPMRIEVAETKHRTVGVGASYQTTFGPGATFEWENRNIGGMGRRLSLQANIAQRLHSGIASFLIPDFYCIGQNSVFRARASHESIKPYRQQVYSLLSRLERQVDDHRFYSVGPNLEYVMVNNSVDNGDFFLVEFPFYFRWSNVEDFLNPIRGVRLDIRGIPTVNMSRSSKFYYSQTASLSTYWPIGEHAGLVLAQKFTLGTIFSNGLKPIPVPKRFFGGSEENLRGYKYFTVSPLTANDKPIGGRSAFYYTFEPRFRLSESIGIVPFFDIGNVYSKEFPTFKGKWFKSTGIGFRYFSFLGPLRLDLAFPLNRRAGIDPHWWIFVSLGQSF